MTEAVDLPPQSKRHSRHVLKTIRTASTHLEKQQAIDEYLYLKVHAAQKPAENAQILRQKVDKLVPCLCAVDAEQLSARGAYYIHHVAGLTKQKRLTMQPHNLAARAALQAERAAELYDAVGFVSKYMQRGLHTEQGPQARLRVLGAARTDVEAALAFPKRAGWDAVLDSLMQSKSREGPVHGPCHSKPVAKQLNGASQDDVELIADDYFYQKIVTTWNVRANQGHIDNELQALLPQLRQDSTRQLVQARAQFYIRHMSEFCDVKLMQQQASWTGSCQTNGKRRASTDQWRLVMHSADSQHFATVLGNED